MAVKGRYLYGICYGVYIGIFGRDITEKTERSVENWKWKDINVKLWNNLKKFREIC
nr:hypothetical protein [uncultured Acetatifactor sp.]